MCFLEDVDRAVRRKFKKVFERLNDDYIVRTPILDEVKIAHIVVEGPNQSWLLVGIHEELPSKEELDKFLKLNQKLSGEGYSELNYLAVCEVGESLFSKKDTALERVSIIEQEEFMTSGEDSISEMVIEVCSEAHHRLKAYFVSESVVNTSCTTRRKSILRDSRSQLQAFFLDYDQELATKYDIWGDIEPSDLDEGFSVRLINGVAGCGKTLILINRALLYCKKYPDKEALLLIHNRPVTEEVKYKIARYLRGQPNNLKIHTFHEYAHAQQRKVSRFVKALMTDKQKKPFIERVFTDQHDAYKELNLSDYQIWSELEYINEFLIEDKDSYLDYERQGRGFSLSKLQRGYIWQLYEQSVKLMSSPRDGYLPSLYIRDLCLSDTNIAFDRYDHILIDEAQFFFPSWLELVKKSIKDNGQLFLCADPNQGFLKSRLSWKSVGLNVRGRTKKLSYSYRTTYEIMVAANALLEYLDENTEDFIRPDLERMERGSKPLVIYSHSLQDEQKRFLNELKSCVIDQGVPLQQIIVLCSEAVKTWDMKSAIETVLGDGTVLNCNHRDDLEKNSFGNKIRLMSINSCTGMEAGVVFVLGIGDLLDKANNLDLGDEEKVLVQQESTRKLYVAMTRAGQKLVLFSTVELPSNVEALVDSSYSMAAAAL